MLRITLLTLLALVAFLAALALSARYLDPYQSIDMPVGTSAVLDNVHIIPVATAATILNQQIIVKDGTVVAIQQAGSPHPDNMLVYDMDGAYLAPGLIDMHVHIDDREQLRLALSYGVTSVRNMNGMPFHLRWRDELNRGQWIGASLYSASPSLHGDLYSSAYDIRVQDAEHATQLALDFKAEGWDQVKVYSGLGLEAFKALLGQARHLELDIVGHLPYSALKSDYDLSGEMASIEHVEEIFQGPLQHTFDRVKLAQVSKQLASSNSVVCPTLSTFYNLSRISSDKERFVEQLSTSHMTPFGELLARQTDIKRWLAVTMERARYNEREFDFLLDIVKELDAAGVSVIAGTDAGTNFVQAGPSMAQELYLMHQAGMSPLSVLRAATINAAKVLGLSELIGTVELGKQADFIVTKNDPLADIQALTEPIAVVKSGTVFLASDLAKLRGGEHRLAGWWLSTGRYIEAITSRLLR